MSDLIFTDCTFCLYAGYQLERAYCPDCGAGPATPSDERVNRITGQPVKMPADPLWIASVWPSTRPARQSIVEDRRLTPSPKGPQGTDRCSEIGGSAARHRRSRLLPDAAERFWRAIGELRREQGRLTTQAVATRMGIDRGTVNSYIANGILPGRPWEGKPIPEGYRSKHGGENRQ